MSNLEYIDLPVMIGGRQTMLSIRKDAILMVEPAGKGCVVHTSVRRPDEISGYVFDPSRIRLPLSRERVMHYLDSGKLRA